MLHKILEYSLDVSDYGTSVSIAFMVLCHTGVLISP